jgi:N-acetylgalactosamine-N,N'-diacetylbacillosaminyl-diphospho-undecaprenol 4-alpha-N-acetylgalactosaminyltransferase
MRKKISIFINSVSAGGAERVVSLLLNELKTDLDIYLVLLNKKIEYDIPDGQKIFCFNQSEKENGIIKIIKLPYLALRYKRFCKKNKIETSLSFLKRANYINCLSKVYGSHSKIIISERTYLSNYLKFIGRSGKISGKYLTRWLYPKAKLIITNSFLIKTDLQKNFSINTKFQVIHNPINLTAIQQAGNVDDSATLFTTFTFISVGGLRREKNYELLIEAFYKIKDLDCKLILIGKGDQENKLKEKVKYLELENRIIFQGFDNNPFKYLSKANCFVLSSNFEGFPNSMQEALACNLPVISTDCQSGPREILASETDINKILENDIEILKYGILVPVNNADQLARAMRLIYNDNNLQKNLREKASERAKDFDIAKIGDQFKKTLFAL